MSCENVQQIIMELGLSAADDRREAAEALRHAEQCAQCQSALRDQERIGAALFCPAIEPPRGGWEGFEQRLVEAIPRSQRSGWRIGRWGAVAASVLLAAGAAFWIGRGWDAGDPNGDGTTVAHHPGISDAEIDRHVRAFEQVAAMFDHRTRWVMLSGEDSELGLSAEPVVDVNLLVVRLALAGPEGEMRLADLAIVAGETAQVTLPLSDGKQLRYHIGTDARQPSRLSLWAEVHGGEQTLAAVGRVVELAGNQSTPAGRLVTAGGAYDLDVTLAQAGRSGS